jgi:hypothetical protein
MMNHDWRKWRQSAPTTPKVSEQQASIAVHKHSAVATRRSIAADDGSSSLPIQCCILQEIGRPISCINYSLLKR